jgi:hypothetical protein
VRLNERPSSPNKVNEEGSSPNALSSEKIFPPMHSAISAFATKKAVKKINSFAGLSLVIV